MLGDDDLFDFFLDFNVAAQTLSGVGRALPYGADYLTVTVPATKAALGPAFPVVLNASGQSFKSLVQLRSGGVRPIVDQGWIYRNPLAGDFLFGLGVGNGALSRAPGIALQSADVAYQLDTDPTLSPAENLFNQSVQRVTADPPARRQNGIANVPPTTGDLRTPMLTLHTLGDLFVLFHMEQEYARRAAAKGNAHNLLQRATRDVGHCTFTPTERVTTFIDLVAWVEGGIRPAGDDVLGPAVVASPTLGCTFTDKSAPRIWDNPQWGFGKPAASSAAGVPSIARPCPFGSRSRRRWRGGRKVIAARACHTLSAPTRPNSGRARSSGEDDDAGSADAVDRGRAEGQRADPRGVERSAAGTCGVLDVASGTGQRAAHVAALHLGGLLAAGLGHRPMLAACSSPS